MLTMKNLPYSSELQTITLTEDTLLSDKDFSCKEDVIAKAGDTVTTKEYANYGVVKHPIYGIFRY